MKFVFPFLGKTREDFLAAGIREYTKRLRRFVGVEIVELKTRSPKGIPEDTFKLQEAELLLARIPQQGHVVALDGSGAQIDSPGLAAWIESWERDGAQNVFFLIGGHLGLHGSVLERADQVLSLSRLTFTHEMCRLFLLEQLYRAWMIRTGRRYHN
ncbi:MAG: 23S rRNA (pseudouridine(1915)-N(3))-methyltransferase RlmH [Desulfobulbaceae bacterium]